MRRTSRACGRRLQFALATALATVAVGGPIAAADAVVNEAEIGAYERARVADPRLMAALGSRDPAIAGRAALALGRTKRANAVRPIVELVRRRPRDPGVRALAVYAAGLLAAFEGSPAIFIASLVDPSDAVRAAACDAAARYAGEGRPDAAALVPPLLRVAAHDATPIVRARAATALVEFARSSEAGAIVAALTRSYDRESALTVRRHIAWTLSRGFATIVPRRLLFAMALDRDETVRIAALRAIGRLRDGTLVASVTPLLDDPSWRVQEEATETLRMLHGGQRSEHLTTLMPGLHVPPADPEPWLPAPDSAGVPPTGPVPLPLRPTSAALITGPMPGLHPRARLTTTRGEIVVRLYPEWAPSTVANYLTLAARGYYDGLRLFRIVPDFVVQTGDPTESGDGDPGYRIGAEENPLEQHEGIISMGLDYEHGLPLRDSAGAQFYITLSPQYHLDRAFTVFGEIESGFAILARLTESDRLISIRRIADD